MKSNTLRELLIYSGMLALFIWVVTLIFATHTDVGFWLQSDNTWAPHFVYDLAVKHHTIKDWQFANGTIHLLDTLPIFVFSLFSKNIINWIHWNAIFNLSMFFLAFILLARALYPTNLKQQCTLICSSLVALTVVLYNIQIPFTLDMLLASAQHTTPVFICLFSLTLVTAYLKHPHKHWLLLILFVVTSAGVFSDELLIAAFVIPMLATLIIFYFQKKKESSPLTLIACITLATIIGRLFWSYSPLSYIRLGVYPSLSLHDIYGGMILYFQTVAHTHPAILGLSIVFFPLGLFVTTRLLVKREFTPLLLALLYCLWEWLSGIGRMTINYHLSAAFSDITTDQHLISAAHLVSVTRDSMDFYIIPIFVGIPLVLIYFLKKIPGATLATIITAISLAFVATTTHLHANTPLKVKIANQQQLIVCLNKQIRLHHLHAGVANYWLYRPLAVLSNDSLPLSPISPGTHDSYYHYLSTWKDIENKNLDFWVARDQRFFQDPTYTSYYSTKKDIAYKLKYFGKPAGQFTCGTGRNAITTYYYRHNEIMQALLPSIRQEELLFAGSKSKASITQHNKIKLQLKSNY